MNDLNLNIPHAFRELFEPSRYKVYYGGRGGAKSWAFAMALLALGLKSKKRVLCARELQASIKDSVHKLLSDVINSYPHFSAHYTILKDVIQGKNGTEFNFRGLKHNATEIKSFEGVDIAWVEEAQSVSQQSWEILIPTIRKDNSEIWICFNPKSATDPTYTKFVLNAPDNAIVRKVSYKDNPFFPKVLDTERLNLQKSDVDAYNHIWEGGLDTRRSGAVYAKQLTTARDDGRISAVPYDGAAEVFTAWDLGFGDATAIWWLQFIGRELHWIDYYENSGEQIEHYVKKVKEKPYNYAINGHYLPHDGAHGNIRGLSITQQLFSLGLGNVVLPRENDIRHGIDVLRQTILFSCFDSKKCIDGLHGLENYAYEWDNDRKMFKDKPTHDWTSHAADAARYAAQAAATRKTMLMPMNDPFKNHGRSGSWMG